MSSVSLAAEIRPETRALDAFGTAKQPWDPVWPRSARANGWSVMRALCAPRHALSLAGRDLPVLPRQPNECPSPLPASRLSRMVASKLRAYSPAGVLDAVDVDVVAAWVPFDCLYQRRVHGHAALVMESRAGGQRHDDVAGFARGA